MRIQCITAAVLVALVGPVMAGTTTASFNAGAKMNATCEITSTPDLSFGEVTTNPSITGEFGVAAGQHTFPITFKCSPYTVVTVTMSVATPEQPGDDPNTLIGRGFGAYGVLTGQRTGTKLTYRFAVDDPTLGTTTFTTNTSYTLSFDASTIKTQNVFTALRENALPPPDFYSDTASITLTF